MKILVDELPYYGDDCIFGEKELCEDAYSKDCPRCWSKYKVCSSDNPHECLLLREVKKDAY